MAAAWFKAKAAKRLPRKATAKACGHCPMREHARGNRQHVTGVVRGSERPSPIRKRNRLGRNGCIRKPQRRRRPNLLVTNTTPYHTHVSRRAMAEGERPSCAPPLATRATATRPTARRRKQLRRHTQTQASPAAQHKAPADADNTRRGMHTTTAEEAHMQAEEGNGQRGRRCII